MDNFLTTRCVIKNLNKNLGCVPALHRLGSAHGLALNPPFTIIARALKQSWFTEHVGVSLAVKQRNHGNRSDTVI